MFAGRKALIIGNSNYTDRPLKNPTNDAVLIKNTLESIGFEVSMTTNADRAQFNRQVSDFSRNVRGDDEIVFYYGGHGVQINGENYLLPVDEMFEDNYDIESKAIKLTWVTDKLSSARVTMVFLDACRDNPYVFYRGGTRGLAAVSGSINQNFIMFSTSPGAVASDGKGNYSDFCYSLSNNLQIPGLSADEIGTRVTNDVIRATDSMQRPWRLSNLMQPYFFVPSGNTEIVRQPTIVMEQPTADEQTSVIPESKDQIAFFDPSQTDRSKTNIGDTPKFAPSTPRYYEIEAKTPKPKSTEYPAITKYLSFLSANEYTSYSRDQYSRTQLISNSMIGLHLPWIGISAEYLSKGVNTRSESDYLNTDNKNEYAIARTGFGFGMPNPDIVRLYATFYWVKANRQSNYTTNVTNVHEGILGEFRKRVTNENQFSEFFASYLWQEIPQDFNHFPIPSNTSNIHLNMNSDAPNTTIAIQAYTSNIANKYHEPIEFQGIAPDSHPLMLLRDSGYALKAKVQFETFNYSMYDDHQTYIEFDLPINFSKVVGLDFGFNRYIFSRILHDAYADYEWLDTSDYSENSYTGTFRLAVMNSNTFKIVPCIEYNRIEAKFKDTNTKDHADLLNGSLFLVLKLGNHFLINAHILSQNTWMLETDPFQFDNSSLTFGSGITVRL